MTRKDRLVIPALALTGLLAAPSVARGGDAQFKAIVNRIQSRYQKRPMRFMGLLCFVANRFRPAGVKNIKLAIFAGLDSSRRPADRDLDAFVQGIAGPEFNVFVKVRSRRDREQTFIYAKVLGGDYELLVVNLESDEACVVQMRVDPEGMSKWIDDPPAMSRNAPASHGGAR